MFLKERKLELPYDPAIPLLGIHPAAAATKSLQLCLTLCDPIDGSKHKFSATEVQSTFALPVKEDGFASIYFNISGL